MWTYYPVKRCPTLEFLFCTFRSPFLGFFLFYHLSLCLPSCELPSLKKAKSLITMRCMAWNLIYSKVSILLRHHIRCSMLGRLRIKSRCSGRCESFWCFCCHSCNFHVLQQIWEMSFLMNLNSHEILKLQSPERRLMSCCFCGKLLKALNF